MGAQRVGQRIHVFWTDETAWFSGVVQEFSPSQGYYVVYDDGDERWEGLTESYRFEGGQGDSDEASESDEDVAATDQQDANHVREADPSVERRATPRAMEPPNSDHDDDHGSETDDDDGVLDGHEAEPARDAEEQETRIDKVVDGYPRPVVLRDEDENETHSEEERDGDDDDTRSVALSEVPITHEPPARIARQQTTVDVASRRALPYRGILRGVVVRATHLPLVNKHDEPTAFTRVAFVEAGSSSDVDGRRQPSALMLRCKQTLSTTHEVAGTRHPIWNDLEEDDDDGHDRRGRWDSRSDGLNGLFQLQVTPPMLAIAGSHHPQPAWQQLKGELLFSVYHQDHDAAQRSEFIGQASLPLHRIARELLSRSSSSGSASVNAVVTQHLPLESRQGKPLGGDDAALVVKFQLEPEFQPDHRRSVATARAAPTNEIRPSATARTVRPTATPSIASSRTRPSSAAASTRTNAAGANRQRPSHQSSSEINRRKFEKKLESENKAIAKRMAEQRREAGAIAARRQQLNHQPPLLKSEPKPGVVAVKTAPPRSHKASSSINRSKFVDQVKQENKSMGKRLIERAGFSGRGRHTAADAKDSKELDWDDDKAQDKAHVADKRRVLRQEKDYVLEKAQAKYQQQSELVEDVMELQTEVAELKAKLFSVKSNLQRVDAMNTKDTHVRDCLRRAVDRAKPTTPSSTTSSSSMAKLEQLLGSEDDEEDEEGGYRGDPTIRKHKTELRGLFQEAASLETEQRRLEDHISELSKQEAALEREILALHRKWQFVQAKRAFHTKMAADRATPAGATYASKELRAKKQAMELSAEEEEQYAIFQAQEELTQLQIAATVLRDRVEKRATSAGPRVVTTASSSAACDYLREKIAKRKTKLETLEAEQSEWRRRYEELVVSGEYETLRTHAQELQHLLFLCQSEAKHVAAAERVATHSKDKKAIELQKQRFDEQTETEILLKRRTSSKASTSHERHDRV